MASEKTNVVKEHILTFLANGDWPDGKVSISISIQLACL